MFMGDAAFVFYFPVLDRYIREEESQYQFDEVPHILGHCIGAHVSKEEILVRPLYDQIVMLCNFVLQHVKNVANDNNRSYSPQELESAWKELVEKTQALM